MIKTSRILLAVNSREMMKELYADGWERSTQESSHIKFVKPPHPHHITLPDHQKKDLGKGLVHSIQKEMRCSDNDPRTKQAITLTPDRKLLRDMILNNKDYGAFLEYYSDMYKKIDSVNGCWLWTGAGSGGDDSYGKIHWGNDFIDVHKFSYYLWNEKKLVAPGEDLGFEIDHECKVQKCFNPKHLQRIPASLNKVYRDTAQEIWRNLPPKERYVEEIERLMIAAIIQRERAARDEAKAMASLKKALDNSVKKKTSGQVADSVIKAGEALSSAIDSKASGAEFSPKYRGMFDKDLQEKDPTLYSKFPTEEDLRKSKEKAEATRLKKKLEKQGQPNNVESTAVA